MTNVEQLSTLSLALFCSPTSNGSATNFRFATRYSLTHTHTQTARANCQINKWNNNNKQTTTMQCVCTVGLTATTAIEKKWWKCVQITRATTTTITIAKLLLTTITTTKKYAQWHFTKIYVCARSTLPFSFYVSLTLAYSISHYAVCFVLCSAATFSSASRALCTAFYALPASISPRLPAPPHFVVVLTENRDWVKFALSAQWKLTRNFVARARQ